MRVHGVRHFRGGEEFAIRQLDSGDWACPICGTPWPYPPLTPVTGPEELSQTATGDVCEGCEIEYGAEEPVDRIGYIRDRTAWLDRVGWNPDAIRQLKDNLGISEEQARREAEEVRPSRGSKDIFLRRDSGNTGAP